MVRSSSHVLSNHSQKIVVELLWELLRLLSAHFALEEKYAASSDPYQPRSGFAKHLGLTTDDEKMKSRALRLEKTLIS